MSIRAPFTQEQVKQLNRYQTLGIMHPFTCANEDCRMDLVATAEGWICPACAYTQNWAHEQMADKAFLDEAEQMLRGLRKGG